MRIERLDRRRPAVRNDRRAAASSEAARPVGGRASRFRHTCRAEIARFGAESAYIYDPNEILIELSTQVVS
jgi:hypothetical protein